MLEARRPCEGADRSLKRMLQLSRHPLLASTPSTAGNSGSEWMTGELTLRVAVVSFLAVAPEQGSRCRGSSGTMPGLPGTR